MRQGELTGAEYFGIMRGIPSLPVGVENDQYYALHRDLFRRRRSAAADRQQLVGLLKGIEADLRPLQGQLPMARNSRPLRICLNDFDKGKVSTEDLVQSGSTGACDSVGIWIGKKSFPISP